MRIILGVELATDEDDGEVSSILFMLYFSYLNYSMVPYEIIILEYYCGRQIGEWAGHSCDWCMGQPNQLQRPIAERVGTYI